MKISSSISKEWLNYNGSTNKVSVKLPNDVYNDMVAFQELYRKKTSIRVTYAKIISQALVDFITQNMVDKVTANGKNNNLEEIFRNLKLTLENSEKQPVYILLPSKIFNDMRNFQNFLRLSSHTRVSQSVIISQALRVLINKYSERELLNDVNEEKRENILLVQDSCVEATMQMPVEDSKTVTRRGRYTDADFLREVFMTADSLEEMMHLLRRKKNIILQGAPGVGKTFSAKRLAYAMMGEKNDDNIGLVQFHQNYSYEDFIMGYKPEDGDFKLKEGVFFRFCRKALSDPEHDYFFIIDEINRGNMSKIFGELLMLIEKDYRGTYATLPYREERFTVPKNVYLIGMMNTADRSLAMIDYALRRRFSFVEMEPGFESEGFHAYQQELHSELFDRVVELIKQLNETICDDDTLGAGFQIGHSYLCGITPEECDEALLKEIVKYDILPTLSEYWFDDTDKAKDWAKRFYNLFA